MKSKNELKLPAQIDVSSASGHSDRKANKNSCFEQFPREEMNALLEHQEATVGNLRGETPNVSLDERRPGTMARSTSADIGKIASKAISLNSLNTQENKGSTARTKRNGQYVFNTNTTPSYNTPTQHRPSASIVKISSNAIGAAQSQSKHDNIQTKPFRNPRGKLASIATLDKLIEHNRVWYSSKKNDPQVLDDLAKLSVAMSATEAANGYAFSLNLGQRRERMLLSHEDPCRQMSHNINKQLRAIGLKGLPYAFAFEVEPSKKRLHLHGVIYTQSLSEEEECLLNKAMCLAASKTTGALKGKRQNHLTDLSKASGWFAYTLKDMALTQKVLGVEKVTFINNPMKKIARNHFESAKQGNKLVKAA